MDAKRLQRGSCPTAAGRFLAMEAKRRFSSTASVGVVRITSHRGHDIRIETTHAVWIDGKRWQLPISVTDAGQLYCSVLPHQQFASAIELVKAVVDNFPDEFAAPQLLRKSATSQRSNVHK